MGKCSLGQWALIDIETSGADALRDKIIDVGYLQFSGTKLVKKYSSLVRPDLLPDEPFVLSHFIQKLTGIKAKQLEKAPTWNQVLDDLLELEGHALIAHNASFEDKFLSQHFKRRLVEAESLPWFEDTLYFLSLLHPGRQQLNLESFIVDYQIAEKEEHRGFSDSLDLLKVLLRAVYLSYQNPERRVLTMDLFQRHPWGEKNWWFNFYQLTVEELSSIAQSIDFEMTDFEFKEQKLSIEILAPQSNSAVSSDQFNAESIGQIFRDEARWRRFFPYYRYRETQEKMALRIGQAFKNKVHALIQAPTGTGKTFANLIPMALFNLNTNGPVLMATGTKTLQQQALTKDIPQMRALLGLGPEAFPIVNLVGSSNHLCELSFRNLANEELQEQDFLSNEKEKFEKHFSFSYFELIFQNNQQKDVNAEYFLRENIPHFLKRSVPTISRIENEIKVDYRSCIGNSCPFKDNCSYIQTLRKAKDAKIIIGNHALMLTWPRSFPRPSYIVVDEAHRLESEVTSAFTLAASKGQLESLLKAIIQMQGLGALFYLLSKSSEEEGQDEESVREEIANLRREALDFVAPIQDHTVGLNAQVETYFKKNKNYSALYWNELPIVKKQSTDKLGETIYHHLDALRFIFNSFAIKLAPYIARYEIQNFSDLDKLTALTRFRLFYGQIEDVAKALDTALSDDEDYAKVMRYHEQEGYSFDSLPIDVGQKVYDNLLQTSDSVVFTSATLADSEGNLGNRYAEWVSGHSLLATEKRFKKGLYLPPVFDYRNRAKVFLCSDAPAFYQAEYIPFVIKGIIPIIEKLEGKTLILFSAKARFEQARELLLAHFDESIPLFIQGMGHDVVEQYKKSSKGILLGMETFGEGIDIPGDALKFVFIDKIPDLRQDIVITKRREFYERHYGNEFQDYFLNTRARSLAQKLGRLLRTENDSGVALVVDSRVKTWKSNTLKQFSTLLMPYQLVVTEFNSAIEEIMVNSKEHIGEDCLPLSPR